MTPHPSSLRRWLTTTNHKDVGLLYLFGSFYFMAAGGALALLMRLQLASPGTGLLTGLSYNAAVTVHGLIMVLWFLSPLGFALANYVVPLQIGARDLAFPRLNALSFWLYLFGGLLAALGFFMPGGAISTGWTVYAPLNTPRFSPGLGTTLGAAGLAMLIASVTASTVNFLTTILRMRAPGLRLLYMPMYSWGILLTVLLMFLIFPALAGAAVLLASDRLLGTVVFSTTAEGFASLLWDHLFWFFGHPEVYVVLFPGLFAMAEVMEVFSGRPLFGRNFIILGGIVASLLSLLVWGHHMFVTGVSLPWREYMTVTTEAISIPFGLITICLILTLFRANVRLTTPMLFALGGLALFIVGGTTGVFNSSVALDYYIRGTYWVVGHFHYQLVGAVMAGLFAGLYYWFPKITGRMFSESLGKLHFALYMVGFNLTFLPLQLLLDMPRRYYTYPSGLGWELPNLVATIGAFTFASSFLPFFINLARSYLAGAPAGPNPWGAWSLEWLIPSPPPRHNFDGQPYVTKEGVIGIRPTEAPEAPVEHFSPYPFLASLGLFIALLGAGLGLPVLLAGAALLLGSVVGWTREEFHIEEPREAEAWPFGGLSKVKLGVWWFLFGEVILFGTLIASYVYARTMLSSSPAQLLQLGAPMSAALDAWQGGLNTFVLFSSSLTMGLAVWAWEHRRRGLVWAGLLGTLVLGLAFLLNKAREWAHLFSTGLTFSSNLQASFFYVVTGAHGAHVAAGLVALLLLLWRPWGDGRGGANTLRLLGLYWYLVEGVWAFLFPLFYLW